MNVASRRTLSALAVVALVAIGPGAAAVTAFSLQDRQAEVAALGEQVDALAAREKRFAPRAGRDPNATPFFEAKTITLAGAAVQQRLEAAVVSAHGRLLSSKVDVGARGDDRRLILAAELTIGEPDIQALLFDLETARPYLFVDALEAQAPEATGLEPGRAVMRVSLTVSGQWSGTK